MLRSIVDAHLPRELGSLPAAWIVPFGPTAHRVIDDPSGTAFAATGALRANTPAASNPRTRIFNSPNRYLGSGPHRITVRRRSFVPYPRPSSPYNFA